MSQHSIVDVLVNHAVWESLVCDVGHKTINQQSYFNSIC